MNVYDEVNNLARAIKECREFTEYKEAKEKVNSVEGLKKQIDEFEKIRYEEQVLALPEVKDYFDKEVRFNVMMADVNKIIGEAIKDVLQ